MMISKSVVWGGLGAVIWLLAGAGAVGGAEAYYALQAGSFSSQANAQQFVEGLKKKLRGAEREGLRVENIQGSFKIRLGRYADKTAARRALALLKKKVHGAFMVAVTDASRPVSVPVSVFAEEPAAEPAAGGGSRQDRVSQIVLKASKCIKQGKYDEAVSILEPGIKAWPDSHVLNGWYGTAMLKKKEFGRALIYFRQAQSRAPGYAEYYNGAGYCLLSLREPRKSRDAFQTALLYDPRLADSLA
ncbi:MAG: hypothetical protein GY868_08785, partial [Deltaproteobacteria bacterium]|nr:hypothetical protein [Deltaproteobacteria bacterium]